MCCNALRLKFEFRITLACYFDAHAIFQVLAVTVSPVLALSLSRCVTYCVRNYF
jgi:hypothetical protein